MGESAFLTDPGFRPQGDDCWVLDGDLRFAVAGSPHNIITVPKGFVTDGASVPRLFWPLIPPFGKPFKAAVLHDYCYATHEARPGEPITRKEADDLFKIAMDAADVGAVKAWTMYLAVRAWGWTCW